MEFEAQRFYSKAAEAPNDVNIRKTARRPRIPDNRCLLPALWVDLGPDWQSHRPSRRFLLSGQHFRECPSREALGWSSFSLLMRY